MKTLIKLVFGLFLVLLVSFLLVGCEGFEAPSGPKKYAPNRTEDSVDVSTCRVFSDETTSGVIIYRCADPEGVYDSVLYITRERL